MSNYCRFKKISTDKILVPACRQAGRINKRYVILMPKKFVNNYEKQLQQAPSRLGRAESGKTEGDKNYLQRKIDSIDKEIDQLVYELYGLMDEEIKIVEGRLIK